MNAHAISDALADGESFRKNRFLATGGHRSVANLARDFVVAVQSATAAESTRNEGRD